MGQMADWQPCYDFAMPLSGLHGLALRAQLCGNAQHALGVVSPLRRSRSPPASDPRARAGSWAFRLPALVARWIRELAWGRLHASGRNSGQRGWIGAAATAWSRGVSGRIGAGVNTAANDSNRMPP